MEAPRRIESSTRFRLVPAATRRLGSDLLVNVGGATAPVQRLMGTGPELWECFERGCTVAEAVAQIGGARWRARRDRGQRGGIRHLAREGPSRGACLVIPVDTNILALAGAGIPGGRALIRDGWGDRLDDVSGHGLAGFLGWAASEGLVDLDDRSTHRLELRLEAEAIRAVQLEGELIRLQQVLTDLPAVVLKGAVLAHEAYPDPSLRPFTDLDILVAGANHADAVRKLEALGYERTRPEPAPGYDARRRQGAHPHPPRRRGRRPPPHARRRQPRRLHRRRGDHRGTPRRAAQRRRDPRSIVGSAPRRDGTARGDGRRADPRPLHPRHRAGRAPPRSRRRSGGGARPSLAGDRPRRATDCAP